MTSPDSNIRAELERAFSKLKDTGITYAEHRKSPDMATRQRVQRDYSNAIADFERAQEAARSEFLQSRGWHRLRKQPKGLRLFASPVLDHEEYFSDASHKTVAILSHTYAQSEDEVRRYATDNGLRYVGRLAYSWHNPLPPRHESDDPERMLGHGCMAVLFEPVVMYEKVTERKRQQAADEAERETRVIQVRRAMVQGNEDLR